MSGNRTSRRPWDTKPVVAASTWASCRPRVCSGICMAGTWTEPASGGSSSAPGLNNELIAPDENRDRKRSECSERLYGTLGLFQDYRVAY